jgi:hypothetical protein
MGPASRARARAAGLLDDDPLDDLPPTAHDFWGEDSAALHDAIQGPAAAEHAQPVATPSSVRAARHIPRLPRPHVRRPQLHLPSGLTGLREARRTWLVLALPLAIAVVSAAAIAGNGSPARPKRSRTATLPSPAAASQSSKAASIGAALPVILGRPRSERASATHVARKSVHRRARTRHVRSRIRSHPRYVSRSSAPTAATPSSPVTNPVTTASPVTPAPAATPTAPRTSSTTSATAASGSHTTSSTSKPPHFGSDGSLGPGSSPDS